MNVRLVLVADAQQRQLHHGQVSLDVGTPVKERAWRYSMASFPKLRRPAASSC
ncbi:hypothetical protein ACFWJM_11810 [Streptomyces sp. NPDC127077]|uniref:hypothetical protein n=1 Tax=Streptomyces sp. NPDC127077 TaxID=3347131 RepID=UPI00365165A0